MKKWHKLLFLFLAFCSCKEPFSPPGNISTDSRYLVIEGFISMNDSTFIRLSRTKKIDTLRTVFPEAGAQVSIESDANGVFPLAEIKAGTYATPPLNLDPSHKYRVRITTADNRKYVSDFVPVKNSPPIDSVGFTAQSNGVQIYVNTHDATNASRYYRWDFTETWQFHSMYISGYYSNGSKILARATNQQVYSCYGNDSSAHIVIASTNKLVNDVVYQSPVTVIPPTSEKLETKYTIWVRQYALTSDAYTFWQNLQTNTEKLGSIFDALPSQSQSNYHCVSNPAELVIGYLSAGNVTTKRIFISASQLPPTYSPQYPGSCVLDTAYDYPALADPTVHNPKLDNILVPLNSPYLPVRGLFIPPDNPFGGPDAYTFSTRFCVDCTLRGTTAQPPFWK
ncbi:MAG: DUF4249 domain-containing protein [Bacteroidetes bacterium]|nr:DUF4249 domain-containing protein [Bacteroidota bacterium]